MRMTNDSQTGRHRLAQDSGANSDTPPCVWCQSRRLVPTGTALEGWERYRCAGCLRSMHVVPAETDSERRSWFRVAASDQDGRHHPWTREVPAYTLGEATERARVQYARDNGIPQDQVTIEVTDGGWRL